MKSYSIKDNYKTNLVQNGKPVPYLDNEENSAEWQWMVYEFAKDLIIKNKLNNVLDIGCGFGVKLMKIILPVCANIMGIDVKRPIEYCRNTYSFGKWLIDNAEKYNELKEKSGNENISIINTWRLEPLPEDEACLPENFSRVWESKTGKNIDYEYERIPEIIRNRYLDYIERLVPRPYILKKVREFCSNFEVKKDRSYLFDINNVYKVMDKAYSADFFVSCDSQEVLDKIINRYGKRVMHYPVRTFAGDRSSRIGIQDALVELLLLSKNKCIYTSFLSTFSEMAWWFGGCKAQVEEIQPRISRKSDI